MHHLVRLFTPGFSFVYCRDDNHTNRARLLYGLGKRLGSVCHEYPLQEADFLYIQEKICSLLLSYPIFLFRLYGHGLRHIHSSP